MPICSKCGKEPVPNLASDAVVFWLDKETNEWSILLIQRKFEPFKGKWALPGGFLEVGETPMHCILRELKEETGLDGVIIDLLPPVSRLGRDGRKVIASTPAIVLVRDISTLKAGDDAAKAHFYPMKKILGDMTDINDVIKHGAELAFDHFNILWEAYKRLTNQAERYTPPYEEIADGFRLPRNMCAFPPSPKGWPDHEKVPAEPCPECKQYPANEIRTMAVVVDFYKSPRTNNVEPVFMLEDDPDGKTLRLPAEKLVNSTAMGVHPLEDNVLSLLARKTKVADYSIAEWLGYYVEGDVVTIPYIVYFGNLRESRDQLPQSERDGYICYEVTGTGVPLIANGKTIPAQDQKIIDHAKCLLGFRAQMLKNL